MKERDRSERLANSHVRTFFHLSSRCGFLGEGRKTVSREERGKKNLSQSQTLKKDVRKQMCKHTFESEQSQLTCFTSFELLIECGQEPTKRKRCEIVVFSRHLIHECVRTNVCEAYMDFEYLCLFYFYWIVHTMFDFGI